MLGVVNEVTPDPLVNTEPPLEASYQSIVSPEPGAADILTVPVEHLVPPVPLGAAGVIHIANTLLSAAPDQSFEQLTRASRLYQVVCVKAPAS